MVALQYQPSVDNYTEMTLIGNEKLIFFVQIKFFILYNGYIFYNNYCLERYPN